MHLVQVVVQVNVVFMKYPLTHKMVQVSRPFLWPRLASEFLRNTCIYYIQDCMTVLSYIELAGS